MRLLYISYTGLLEPLGQSQVLQYLKRLADCHQVSLLSYEKASDWKNLALRRALREELAGAGISWCPLRYHKSPSTVATAYDILVGSLRCLVLARRRHIQIIHARGYVAAIIALVLKCLFSLPFVFDMRGFWADEKVDAGTWIRDTAVYRGAKRIERSALLKADVVVSLTRAGVEAMRAFDYLQRRRTHFEVIPTCANLELFYPPLSGFPRNRRFTVGYVGNAGGWYYFEPVLEAYSVIRSIDSNARLLVINRDQHELIHALLIKHHVPRDCVEMRSLPFRDVGDAVREMDATCFFIKPVFSKLASAPTKLAEFLACGVPCMVNDGVGDMGRIVREEGVGVVVQSLDAETIAAGAREILKMARDPQVRTRCVETARRLFSLDAGVAAYDRIYKSLAEPTDPASQHS